MLAKAEGLEGLAMQRDYLEAYTCVTLGREVRALELANRHLAVKHPTWHTMFAAVIEHVKEAQGEEPSELCEVAEGAAGRDAAMEQGAKGEIVIDLAIEGRQIELEYDNVAACTLNFYRMDLELLFSTNPFMQGSTGQAQFSFIKPNLSVSLQLDPEDCTHIASIPEQFHSDNIMVEAVAAGKRSAQPFYAHSMRCDILESTGQIKVSDGATGAPLSQTYVKVYSQASAGGEAEFYKDGYTDRRGRFDYVSLSTNQLDRTTRFAILILSTTSGGIIKHVSPPAR